MGEFGIGQPVPREEDPYLVRGDGRYVDDVSLVNQARAYVVRSQHSHAKLVSIDVKRARQSPGVLHILTGNDPAVLALGLQQPKQPRKRRDGSPQFATPMPLLARDRVRFIGQPVAMIIAETLNEAKDAAELIEAEYEGLPSATTIEEAIAPDATPVWDECRDNLAYFHEAGNKAAAAEAIAKADLVIKHQMRINRLTTVSMEPRGCLAEYDPRDERYTLRCTVQGPHQVRRTLAQDVFKIPESRIRVISDNVGGGFGMKGGVYPEYQLAMLAAKLTGRPVKWIGDRSESFLSDEHCRDNITEAELALDKNGKFLAIRVRNYCNIGAYNASDRSGGPPTNNIGVLAGTYTFPAGIRRGERHLHQHHAHRPLSRRRAAGGGLRARDAGRPRRAQARHRSGGAAPQEHDPEGGDAVQDRAGLHLRLRRLRQEPRRLPRDGGLQRLRGAPPGFVEARQAARARHLQHRRSVERRPDRAFGAALRSVRRAHPLYGHARPRPGSRHRLPADHRRQARHPARPRALPVRRHRPDRDRHRHLRLALDGLRRHRAADGRRQGHRQGEEARGAHARGRRARHRVRERQVHRRRAPTRPSTSPRSRGSRST